MVAGLSRVIRALAVLAALTASHSATVRAAEPPWFGPAAVSVGSGGETILRFASTAPVEAEAFTLDAPPRVVLELPELRWRLAPLPAAGLVAGLRHGLAAPGRARVVIDLAGPARVAGLDSGAGGLVLRLESVSPEAFAAKAGWPGPDATPAVAGGAAPVVVIDPGHGGRDPGAVVSGLREKDITLAVSLMLAEALRAEGLTVVLTREGDRFVTLDERVATARAAGASLLLSLHADTVTVGERAASGASVYLPAAEASDALAASLAARENAADGTGPGIVPAEGRDVAALLSDLARRETALAGRRLGPLLVEALAAEVPVLASRPLRAAAFRVLKAPDVPSALVELGFLSNAEDRVRLLDLAWRQAAVRALVAGVQRWFAGGKPLSCETGPCHRRD